MGFMDAEREHLVAPVRRHERGLTAWVGLALLFAGIIVTVGGIYEWNRRKAGDRPAVTGTSPPAPVRSASVAAAEPAMDQEVRRLQQQLAEEKRARIAAEARAFQIEQEAAQQRPRRCIDGVRFEQFGREWRNVGRCASERNLR